MEADIPRKPQRRVKGSWAAIVLRMMRVCQRKFAEQRGMRDEALIYDVMSAIASVGRKRES